MKKIWQVAGIASFWVLSPILFFYLRLNSRTRVIIRAKGEVLLVKPWLGSGIWDLPGGGLHIKENPIDGALREVLEETGLSLGKKDIKPLGEIQTKSFLKSSKVYCFYADLSSKPPVKKQFIELIDIRWVKTENVEKYPLHAYSKNCFDLWQKRE